MKTILITGAAGYIGSHCALEIQRAGYKCIVLDNLSEGHKEAVNADKFYKVELSQIDEVFKNLIETIKRFDAKEIFLPGGGDILIPEFFEDFCRENGISIHIITIELLREFLNYN